MPNKTETYQITEGGFDVEVSITGDQGARAYQIMHRQLPPATAALIDQLKQELIGTVRIGADEILDPKIVGILKERFQEKALTLLKEKLPKIDTDIAHRLVMDLVKDMLGLGDIELLLNDPFLEEIVVISSSEPVRVFHKKYGWLKTNIYIPDESHSRDHFNTIARRVGRQITNLNPLLDAHLLSGDRANAVLYPIASKGNTLTIRKFARDPWTVIDFITNNTCSSEIFALLWLAMQYEANILISGGTGSGKTSLLNVCMPFIPPNHRIISIEDTRELMLPDFLFWCPLTTRQPNPEGKGEVTMLHLLTNSLRMRPDRIVLGEMRKKDQAEVLFEAMHTGHSVYATVHADSIHSTIQRLSNPPIDVPPNLLAAVHLNVVMFRNKRENIRRVIQLGEYLPTEDRGEVLVKPNILYRWDPAIDKIVIHQKAIRFFEDLNRHTGLDELKMKEDLNQKKEILEFMVKHKIRDIASVGKVFHLYYQDSSKLLNMISSNDPQKIIEMP